MQKMNINIHRNFVSDDVYSKMELQGSSETSVHIYCTTLHHVPQERNHYLHRHESFLIKFRYSLRSQLFT